VTTVNAARVLITGASRGLGHALAAELHGRGYDVVATPRALSDVADLDASDKVPLDVHGPLLCCRQAGSFSPIAPSFDAAAFANGCQRLRPLGR
jgi:NAD(P)-dependent dehydrogenase (short-subunit alcohol dehydrogenase family)